MPAPNVVLQEMGSEGLMVDLERNVYFTFNSTATLAWLALEAGQRMTVGALVDHLLARFDVSRARLLADLDALLQGWLAAGLVITDPPEEDAS